MSSCLILYFSQGNTTARVGEAIAKGLSKAGYTVDMQNIVEIKKPEIKGYDLVGIGTPVYMYTLPFNVSDLLNELPQLNDLPFFTYILYGTYSGDTLETMNRLLYSKGAQIAGSYTCHGEGTFLPYARKGFLFSPGHPNKEELLKAEDFGYSVGSGLQVAYDPASPLSPVYKFERFALSRWMVAKFHSRLFKVNRSKCKKCMRCVTLCPSKNINPGSDGYPAWGRDCLLCLFCEMKCPNEAISSTYRLPLFKPFLAYNVKRASRDISIDHERVAHSKGQIKRLGQ